LRSCLTDSALRCSSCMRHKSCQAKNRLTTTKLTKGGNLNKVEVVAAERPQRLLHPQPPALAAAALVGPAVRGRHLLLRVLDQRKRLAHRRHAHRGAGHAPLPIMLLRHRLLDLQDRWLNLERRHRIGRHPASPLPSAPGLRILHPAAAVVPPARHAAPVELRIARVPLLGVPRAPRAARRRRGARNHHGGRIARSLPLHGDGVGFGREELGASEGRRRDVTRQPKRVKRGSEAGWRGGSAFNHLRECVAILQCCPWDVMCYEQEHFQLPPSSL
jgi:hypothetical protein